MSNPNLDETHSASLKSWVDSSAYAGDFPLQNLPFGVFRRGSGHPRIGTAIGRSVLDLERTVSVGVLGQLDPGLHEALIEPTLNRLFGLGRPALRRVRHAVHSLLRADSTLPRPPEDCLIPLPEVELLLPVSIGDYSDFYASIHHASNVGSMFRPEQPLLPNYKWVPIGYHGRASSIVPSGTAVRRPLGQLKKESSATPAFGPTAALDFESEVGMWVGKSNALGESVPIGEAEEHLAGCCLVNDWSARDVQRWEYQPLGPFLSKSFATSLSPWVVTLDALEPFRVPAAPRPSGDPAPLPYLDGNDNRERGGIDLSIEVWLTSAQMREQGRAPLRLSQARFAELYWTAGQLLTHHTSNGCNLRPGDLLASGTVSGPEKSNRGCLLELTWGGKEPLVLPSGEVRTFLADGDEVVMKASCSRAGFASIGFGECRGMIVPA
jgi:fumarylacetoacetase